MVWGGGGGVGEIHTPKRFSSTVPNVWHQRVETFSLLILTYGSLCTSAFIDKLSGMLPWQHFYLTEPSRVTLVENDINPLYLIKFILCGKTDIKYATSVTELIPPPDFSLIPMKIETLVKNWTLTRKT